MFSIEYFYNSSRINLGDIFRQIAARFHHQSEAQQPGKSLTKFQDPIIRKNDMSSVTQWLAADEVSEDVIKSSLKNILTTIGHVHRLKTKAW